MDSPSGSGDANRTLSLPAMLPDGYSLSWCQRPLSRALCCGASTLQMDQADSAPARFYKEATGPERPEDEFGILEDDRFTDTGVFQPRYLVLVFACSPPPPPRPRVSHTILTRADRCSTRAVARCRAMPTRDKESSEEDRPFLLQEIIFAHSPYEGVFHNRPSLQGNLLCRSDWIRSRGISETDCMILPTRELVDFPRCNVCEQLKAVELFGATAPVGASASRRFQLAAGSSALVWEFRQGRTAHALGAQTVSTTRSQTSGRGSWMWLEITALVSLDRYLRQRRSCQNTQVALAGDGGSEDTSRCSDSEWIWPRRRGLHVHATVSSASSIMAWSMVLGSNSSTCREIYCATKKSALSEWVILPVQEVAAYPWCTACEHLCPGTWPDERQAEWAHVGWSPWHRCAGKVDGPCAGCPESTSDSELEHWE